MEPNRLRRLTEGFCAEVGRVIQAEVSGQIKTLIDDMKKAVAKRNIPPHCVFDGCKEPHCGPKYSFLCREHRESKAKKEAAK